MATYYKKKEMTNPSRRCLNCGKDISYKRINAKFCCQGCYEGWYGIDHRQIHLDMKMGVL